MPEPVRGNLVALAAFIDRHTLELIGNPDPDKVEILISINRELAMGLYTDTTVAAEGQAASSPTDAAKPDEAGSFSVSA